MIWVDVENPADKDGKTYQTFGPYSNLRQVVGLLRSLRSQGVRISKAPNLSSDVRKLVASRLLEDETLRTLWRISRCET